MNQECKPIELEVLAYHILYGKPFEQANTIDVLINCAGSLSGVRYHGVDIYANGFDKHIIDLLFVNNYYKAVSKIYCQFGNKIKTFNLINVKSKPTTIKVFTSDMYHYVCKLDGEDHDCYMSMSCEVI